MPTRQSKWRPVKLGEIKEVIAESFWEYRLNGRTVVSRLAIGHPHPDPSGQDWYCPVLIEGRTKAWTPIYGVFGLDALINAARYAHAFFHDVKLTDIRETRRKVRRRAGKAVARVSGSRKRL